MERWKKVICEGCTAWGLWGVVVVVKKTLETFLSLIAIIWERKGGSERGYTFLNKESWALRSFIEKLVPFKAFWSSVLLCVIIAFILGHLVYFSLHLPDLSVLVLYLLSFLCDLVYFWILSSVHNWIAFFFTNKDWPNLFIVPTHVWFYSLFLFCSLLSPVLFVFY